MRLRPLPLRLALISLAVVVAPAAGYAAFPGANGKIAFVRAGQVHVMNPDGSGQAALTTLPGTNIGPRWSPDGSRIVFASSRDGNSEIYVMNADGSGQTRLTNDPAADTNPAWSPDGARIAFASDRGGAFDIYVMNADGSAPQNLTNNDSGFASNPAWSPDGARIAFTSAPPGGGLEISVMNADGSGQTILTSPPNDGNGPAWSPDGTRIAFTSQRDGNLEIYVMNPDGTGQTRLTTHLAVDASPAWSPDGTRIAFHTFRDGNAEVYVMNTDGSGPIRLTTDAASDTAVDWQPAPDVALGSARIWLAATRTLGMPVDVSVRILLDGDDIGGGTLTNASIGTAGFPGAVLHTIPLARAGGPVGGNPGDTLAVRVSLRRSCSGAGGPLAGGVALWYNGAPIDSGAQRDAGSRFSATIGGLPDDFFLRSVPAFSLSRDAGTKRTFSTLDLDSSSPCPLRPFAILGTWTMTLPGAGISGAWIAQPTQRCKGAGAGAHCEVRATLRVFNPGTATAARSIAQVYLSDDGLLDADDRLVEPALHVHELDAGEGDEVKVRVQLRGESAAGRFLIAVVDATDEVAEANEANNVVVSAPVP